jgi:hypothetical protein
MALSTAHRAALDRPRRIIVEYDANDPVELIGSDFDAWLEFRFAFADQPESQIDSIMWELHPSSDVVAYQSDLLPYTERRDLRRWRDAGIDWLARSIEATRQRGIEVWWTHRISEVDLNADNQLEMQTLSPLKAEHPDWTLPSWWWQGMWNLDSPGLRAHKVAELRELAARYDLDGIQVNFARHLPVLPVGRQWQLRAGPTDLMRQLRNALQEVAAARGKPILLAAKVPETIAGCRQDGLDVVTWAQEGLVDLLSLGSRTLTQNVATFRDALGAAHVKLCPCFDDHHASDAYRHAPIEVLRGVFGNWLKQGADGVETFNWSNAPPAYYAAHGISAMNASAAHEVAYREVGDLATLRGKDRTYVVERRGVFPWSEGYFCRNEHFDLPLKLANDGTESAVSLRVDGTVAHAAGCSIAVVLYAMQPGDRVGVWLNDVALGTPLRGDAHQDPQLFSPGPQPVAGAVAHLTPDPEQRLTLLTFSAPLDQFRDGVNQLRLTVAVRGPFPIGADLQVEKIEAHFRYDSGG